MQHKLKFPVNLVYKREIFDLSANRILHECIYIWLNESFVVGFRVENGTRNKKAVFGRNGEIVVNEKINTNFNKSIY
jgi:hypothetical protein